MEETPLRRANSKTCFYSDDMMMMPKGLAHGVACMVMKGIQYRGKRGLFHEVILFVSTHCCGIDRKEKEVKKERGRGKRGG